MCDWVTLGIIFFFVCAMVNRLISERALKYLSDDQKALIVDVFSRMRACYLIPIVSIIVVFFGANFLMPGHSLVFLVIFLILLACYAVAMHIIVMRKLRKYNLPNQYIRSILLSRGISFVGLAVLFGAIFISL
jgi:hypothetical protein